MHSHPNQKHLTHLCSDSTLYVIAVITNPVRYHSRYRLFEEFRRRIEKSPNVVLYVVEAAFGDRPHVVTEAGNPCHIQFRTRDEVWHKENLINLGIARLPHDWKYVAWIDADIEFMNSNWALETIHKLQHYHVVQMWQTALDLGPNGEIVATHHSFMSQYKRGAKYCYGKGGKGYEHWHPGYAWAARRDAIDATGGLIDTAILGAGDNHMAHALIGMLDQSMQKGLHPNYIKHLKIWGDRAERHIKRNVGFVPGTILHFWHGSKVDRGYHSRWKILIDHQYDPDLDIKRDWQGLIQLADNKIGMRDDLRFYFRGRNEDSTGD